MTTEEGLAVREASVPRTYAGFGQIRELTVNAADGEGDDRYKAFEATFSKSYSQGLVDARLVFGPTGATRKTSMPRNPNEALYGI